MSGMLQSACGCTAQPTPKCLSLSGDPIGDLSQASQWRDQGSHPIPQIAEVNPRHDATVPLSDRLRYLSQTLSDSIELSLSRMPLLCLLGCHLPSTIN
jgi:hypothetical protein